MDPVTLFLLAAGLGAGSIGWNAAAKADKERGQLPNRQPKADRKCSRCGTRWTADAGSTYRCPKCG